LPLNSAILATRPLSEAQWRAIGWDGHEILGDFAHAYFYAQRTASGRIAFGGRGIPYRFGSRTDHEGETQAATMRLLHAMLLRHFPQLQGVEIEHGWCGVLGVPRDWCATVGLSGHAHRLGGGYVGLGVSTSNVAGRTLADLALGRHSALTALPWVNRRVRAWEPEPLRWLAVNGLYAAYRRADRQEEDGRPGTAPLARLADRLVGR
jgi:glycine/D-amino acid oxidase-like deaminating enzyme